MSEMSGFARRLTDLMQARGWDRMRLSKETGIPYHRLSPWFMRPTALPRGDDLDVLCTTFITTNAWLLRGEGASPSETANLLAMYDQMSPGRRQKLLEDARDQARLDEIDRARSAEAARKPDGSTP